MRRVVVLVVQEWEQAEEWAAELEELLVRVGHRFGRVDLRQQMRAYVRGLLGPVSRKNGWQLAEYAGHDSPGRLQHLLMRGLAFFGQGSDRSIHAASRNSTNSA